MQSLFITYYTETNLICFLFISFLLYSYTRESRGLAEAKWFQASLATIQLYCVSDIIAALYKNQTFPGARFILWISNSTYITIPLILVIFWNQYLKEHMRAHYHPEKAFQILDRIFPVLSVIFCIVSFSTPLTHIVFYLDDLNGYHRAFGAYFVPVFAYLFMIYETIKLRMISKNSHSLQVKQDADILSLFAIPCIFFSLFQVAFYGTTVSQVGFTMGLMIVFIGRQQNKISRDELTGLNNRREYEYAIDRLAHTSGTVLIVMIDVNRLKTINDTFGHLEGDEALRNVAGILRNVCSKRKHLGSIGLYRYAGDEFVMLSTDPNAAENKDHLTAAVYEEVAKRNGLSQKPYSISLSVGAVVGSYSGKGVFALIDAADKAMYAEKTRIKRETGISTR